MIIVILERNAFGENMQKALFELNRYIHCNIMIIVFFTSILVQYYTLTRIHGSLDHNKNSKIHYNHKGVIIAN